MVEFDRVWPQSVTPPHQITPKNLQVTTNSFPRVMHNHQMFTTKPTVMRTRIPEANSVMLGGKTIRTQKPNEKSDCFTQQDARVQSRDGMCSGANWKFRRRFFLVAEAGKLDGSHGYSSILFLQLSLETGYAYFPSGTRKLKR